MTGFVDRSATRSEIRRVLALECACREQDFRRGGLRITAAEARVGRRRFPPLARPLLVMTMGAGVVVSAHPDRLAWLRSGLEGLDRDAIFAPPIVGWLGEHLARDRQYLVGPAIKFACSPDYFRPAPALPGLELAVLDGEAIDGIHRDPGFDNALGYGRDDARPDVLVTVARRQGVLLGVAGASAENDVLWQIGVDVVAGERGAGIGRLLVSHLTEAVFARGRIPYYSAAVSNIRSLALAASLGYWPAWTELHALDRLDNL